MGIKVEKAGSRAWPTALAALLALALFVFLSQAAFFSSSVTDPPAPPAVVQAGRLDAELSPLILSAYLDPLKVRPGDSMLISTSVSDPSGVSSVFADMGGIEPSFFIPMAHYAGWWNYG